MGKRGNLRAFVFRLALPLPLLRFSAPPPVNFRSPSGGGAEIHGRRSGKSQEGRGMWDGEGAGVGEGGRGWRREGGRRQFTGGGRLLKHGCCMGKIRILTGNKVYFSEGGRNTKHGCCMGILGLRCKKIQTEIHGVAHKTWSLHGYSGPPGPKISNKNTWSRASIHGRALGKIRIRAGIKFQISSNFAMY